MKRIINKKCYNTETAEFIQEYWNGVSKGDFEYVYEKLYRTQKESWFLHASGGAMSDYCCSYGKCTCGNTVIIPFSEDETYDWLEKNNKVNEIEKYFSNKIVDA